MRYLEPREIRAALETISGDSPPDDACIDYPFFVHERRLGNLEAARAYLAWEQALPERIDDGRRAALQPLALDTRSP